MSDAFDPYLSWLGIRDPRRPPNHYRLLGVELFENDPDILSNAADRQMAHVRTFQSGKHSELSQRLLNELSAAKICLLNSGRKASYDKELRTEIGSSSGISQKVSAPPPSPVPPPPPPRMVPPPSSMSAAKVLTPPPRVMNSPELPRPQVELVTKVARPARPRALWEQPLFWGIGCLVVLGSVAGWIALGGLPGPDPDSSQKDTVTAELPITLTSKTPTPAETPRPDPQEVTPRPMPVEGTQRPATVTPDGQVRSFSGSSEPVTDLSFARGGELLIASSEDGALRAWTARDGERHWKADAHEGPVQRIAAAPESGWLLSGGRDKRVRIWELASGEGLGRLRRENEDESAESVLNLAVSPDDRWAVTVETSQRMFLWNVAKRELSGQWEGPQGRLVAVGFSPEGNQVRAITQDGTCEAWSLPAGERQTPQLLANQWVSAAYFAPDGKHVVLGGRDGVSKLIEIETQEVIATYGKTDDAEPANRNREVRGLKLSLDGRHLLTADAAGKLRLWGVKSGNQLSEFQIPNGKFRAVTMSPDSQFAATGEDTGLVRLWKLPLEPIDPSQFVRRPASNMMMTDPAAEVPVGELTHFRIHEQGASHQVAWSRDGKLVASAGSDGTVQIVQVQDSTPFRAIPAHPGGVLSVAFGPDQLRILTGGQDRQAKLWSLKDGSQLQSLEGHTSPVRAVAILDDNKQALTIEESGMVRLFDLETGQPVKQFTSPTWGDRWSLPTSGSLALSGGYDGMVRIWQVASGQDQLKWNLPGGWVTAVAGGPPTKFYLAGDDFGRLHVWDSTTNRKLLVCAGHQGPIWAIAVSQDRQQALTAGQDRQLILWDLPGGQKLHAFSEFAPDPLTSVAFAPNGRTAIGVGRDGLMRVFGLPARPDPSPGPDLEALARATEKQPPPPGPEMTSAEAQVQQTFKTQYTAAVKNLASRIELAGLLLTAAKTETPHTSLHFVLLREARDEAALSGDLTRAQEALDLLDRFYQIDLFEMRAEALTQAVKTLPLPLPELSKNASLAAYQKGVELVEQAISADRLETATKAIAALATLNRKQPTPALTAQIQLLNTITKTLKNVESKVHKTREALAADPLLDDANAELGKHLCLTRSEWGRGLPLLALGSDASLRSLAVLELSQPTDPNQQMELGRRWSEYAETLKGTDQVSPQVRAYGWYRRAATHPQVAEAKKALAEQKLAGLGRGLAKRAVSLTTQFKTDIVVNPLTGFTENGTRVTPQGASPILVQNRPVRSAVHMFPPDEGSSHVSYWLFKQFRVFEGFAAVGDGGDLQTTLTFRIHGDGRVLWERDLTQSGETQPFHIDVTGITKLELEVHCGSSSSGARATWIETTLWDFAK